MQSRLLVSVFLFSYFSTGTFAHASAFVCRVQCKAGGDPVFIDQTDRGGSFNQPGFCGYQRFHVASKKAFHKAFVDVGTQTFKRFSPYVYKDRPIPEAEKIVIIADEYVDIQCVWSETLTSNDLVEKLGGKPKVVEKPVSVCKKPEQPSVTRELKSLEKVFDRIRLDLLTVRTDSPSALETPKPISRPMPSVEPVKSDPELEDPAFLLPDMEALRAERARLVKEIQDLLAPKGPSDIPFVIDAKEDERPLVFIVDVSSSMAGYNRAATMRLIRETIAKMPASRKFNILTMSAKKASLSTYSTDPRAFRDTADTNRDGLGDWINLQLSNGGASCEDFLIEAFKKVVEAQPESEIYVISDFEMAKPSLEGLTEYLKGPQVHCVDFNPLYDQNREVGADALQGKSKREFKRAARQSDVDVADPKATLLATMSSNNEHFHYSYRGSYAEAMSKYTGGSYTNVDATGGEFKVRKFATEDPDAAAKYRDKLIAQKRARIAEIDVQLNDLQNLVDRINAKKSNPIK